ncbi:UDP-N-acetylmuramoyl-tripeptide--D-alanyl-D-alanine ligase [Ureibacillus aquaedulcis]|uniref:UDP-N-acetylmuramoyl-tripeptide--D-alanyl-D-alanine ligase n=1 Tax=Ureibacillus aquaedulcis TaxID=3058421 RepID=A0ABT8GU96_9BACL|nr:UDP-N-acetylmuramoyl-tripeptide--D-alanyl-D-alanine ligase [Ureibacillus sp. BA0131]MDN4494979.1 UDP-N-acetylmuramoyl-tripeptide--D-alanyl-D-alanine ligase [Ureibacillus sp. BA0131]
MKALYLNEIISQIGGTWMQGEGNPLIKDVVTKPSRISHNNTLMIDLYTKSRIDSKLFKKYSPVVVVTEKPKDFAKLGDEVIVIKVDDIEQTYWKFIDYYRDLFDIPIIGITGTCGKTTTKEMIKHILESSYPVLATYKSFNGGHRNHRYLLGIDENTGASVIEMGVDSPGDILFYLKYFRPQIRVLLNIDVYHLVGCETPEGYLKAKAEILHGLDPVNGCLILNADDENIKRIDISKLTNIIQYIGFSEGCHFRATDVTYDDRGTLFTLHHQKQTYPVFVPAFGEHNVYNALAAIAATWNAGVHIMEAVERLSTFQQVKEHLELKNGLGGSTIIDDTWNVAPLSMASALKALKEMAGTKRKIALLGYMPQLGDGLFAEQQYSKMGEKAVEAEVDLLIVVGEEARKVGSRALEMGMDQSKVYFSGNPIEIYQILQPYLNPDSIILLKIPHRVMVQDTFKELKEKIIIT